MNRDRDRGAVTWSACDPEKLETPGIVVGVRPDLRDDPDADPPAVAESKETGRDEEIRALTEESAALTDGIERLKSRHDEIRRRLCRLRSQAWVAEMGVKRSEVMDAYSECPRWFHTIDEFVRWLRTLDQRPKWVAWSDVIYSSDDLIAGRMPDMPGLLTDVPDDRPSL